MTPDEVLRLRRLGVTRVQLGVQSLDDRILALNGRGHDVEATRRACRLLRAAGFKLHLHWMPNLYGATPQSDREDFARLWADPDIRPDDLKIYPTALLAGTGLYDLWQQGAYQPYDETTLVELLADCKAQTPPYCRLTRVVRDIPADYILAGSRASNLRETVQQHLAATGRHCRCIRCREVGDTPLDAGCGRSACAALRNRRRAGALSVAWKPATGRLAGFLRLLLPWTDRAIERPAELEGCALIRELHVYGPALHIGARVTAKRSIAAWAAVCWRRRRQSHATGGWRRIAVIAALGTETYYRRHGFTLDDLYMHKAL